MRSGKSPKIRRKRSRVSKSSTDRRSFRPASASEIIKSIAHKIAVVPEGFNVNPKMVGQLARRAKMGDGSLPLDWAFAEAVAFGSLVLEGTRVRLSGQDSAAAARSASVTLFCTTRRRGKAWTPLSELRSESNPGGAFRRVRQFAFRRGRAGF